MEGAAAVSGSLVVENKDDVVVTVLHGEERDTKERRLFPFFKDDAVKARADDTKRLVAIIIFQRDLLLGGFVFSKEGIVGDAVYLTRARRTFNEPLSRVSSLQLISRTRCMKMQRQVKVDYCSM